MRNTVNFLIELGSRLQQVNGLLQIELGLPTWVVESDGDILGGLIMEFDEERALIANIAVDPRFQGQGIGGELMKFVEAKAREKNYTELQLATHVLLHENISLYRHLGWREIAREDNRVMMRKII